MAKLFINVMLALAGIAFMYFMGRAADAQKPTEGLTSPPAHTSAPKPSPIVASVSGAPASAPVAVEAAFRELAEDAKVRISASERLVRNATQADAEDDFAAYRRAKELRDTLASFKPMQVPLSLKGDARAAALVDRVQTLVAVRFAALQATLAFLETRNPAELSTLEAKLSRAKILHREASEALAALKTPT